ncbi:hypothetical protein Q0601_14280 [Paracoccus onubensis]|uniref:hypothetical protein n=1 Tax=Paracoccus onubensis TaxID=1675788 RepID=UPI002730C401|nr:hypothetical protein [Paracoccus onubensis]MDP0928351.1 hypothetical protein [Paracoccus onubensis]
MMRDVRPMPKRAAQRPSVGWVSFGRDFHFMVQLRMVLNLQDSVTKAPARWGGRALRGGPSRECVQSTTALDSARGNIFAVGQ